MSSLKKYEMKETSSLHLKDAANELMYADDADGKPDLAKPMRWIGYGPGSKQFAKAMNAKQNLQVDLLKSSGKTKESVDEAQLSNAEFLADCTHSFEHVDSDHGHTGRDLSIEIFMNQKLSFIRDQIGVFINKTENFAPPSTKV